MPNIRLRAPFQIINDSDPIQENNVTSSNIQDPISDSDSETLSIGPHHEPLSDSDADTLPIPNFLRNLPINTPIQADNGPSLNQANDQPQSPHVYDPILPSTSSGSRGVLNFRNWGNKSKPQFLKRSDNTDHQNTP